MVKSKIFLLVVGALAATTLALPVRLLRRLCSLGVVLMCLWSLIPKPHKQYARYVARHKWFVFQAGRTLRVHVWRLIWHDWTKFLPREWFPYTKFFYGPHMNREKAAELDYDFPCPDDIELAFEQAWNHHQHKNDHHWQFWVRIGDDGSELVLPMPDNARREMLADWRGAGRALGKPDTAAWYKANQDKMKLHEETRAWIEKQLGLLD